VLCQGGGIEIGDLTLKTNQAAQFMELVIDGSKARVLAGNAGDIESITRGSETLEIAGP